MSAVREVTGPNHSAVVPWLTFCRCGGGACNGGDGSCGGACDGGGACGGACDGGGGACAVAASASFLYQLILTGTVDGFGAADDTDGDADADADADAEERLGHAGMAP